MSNGVQIAEQVAHNPFASELGRANSAYAAFNDTRLTRVLEPETTPTPVAEFVHDSFRALVLNPKFSCVGAKSAIQRGDYRIGLYDDMASAPATAGLAYDLWSFVQEQPSFEGEFSTFVASFTGPVVSNEDQFERLLWTQLQCLHDLDYVHHTWDPAVSSDPTDPQFSFSFAGRAFFVVGLHPASSRWTRRFAWPTLVFNAHQQFEQLRSSGRFERIQSVIRERERKLQGSINVNLTDFGERSEARQYSGRPVESEWRCPFHTHTADE